MKSFGKRWRIFRFGLIAVALSCFSADVIGQATSQRRFSQDDIEIQVDQEWTPVNSGGYYPVMLTIKNRGPDASLRIHTDVPDTGYAYGTFTPIVQKRIELAQNATTQMTLLLPVVSRNSEAMLQVEKNGQALEEIQILLTFAHEPGSQSFLVIDENLPNTSVFQRYCANVLESGLRSSSSARKVVQRMPNVMPDTWLAYSGIDVVFADARSFALEMENAQRSELLRWVSTGGSLVIYDVDRLEKKLEAVNNAIESANWSADDSGWDTTNSPGITYDDQTTALSQTLVSRPFLFGKLVATEQNPFEFVPLTGKSTARERNPGWNYIFSTLGIESANWVNRHGFIPRSYSGDFLRFLNPGIQKIPTWGFVMLITLFAVMIGPLNYWMLRRKNKVSQLLWTTPLIALLTSLILFGWSSLANGTSNHVRLRSLSILDQTSQSMVSQTRIAMFSGITPRDGLRFEPFSAVYPIWQEENSFESGVVDWTDAQVMTGSFHKGNSRSQFMVCTPRTERGRLQIGENTAAGLSVTNGLEWNMEYLLLRDKSGNYFFGKRLDAGQSLVLEPASDVDVKAIRERVAHQKLKSPNVRPPSSNSGISRRPYARYSPAQANPAFSAQMANNLVEKKFAWLQNDLSMDIEEQKRGKIIVGTIDHGIPHSSYLAILAEQPDLDVGLQSYRTTEELHVLLGLFDE